MRRAPGRSLRRPAELTRCLINHAVERHRPFFRCARELASTYALPTQRIVYYLVTDSLSLKVDAQRVFGSKLIVTDSVPQHVHQKGGHEDGVFNAVVENWILKKTDMRVVTQDSGFVSPPRVCSLMTRSASLSLTLTFVLTYRASSPPSHQARNRRPCPSSLGSTRM